MSDHDGRAAASRYMLTLPIKTTLLVTICAILIALVLLYVETYDMTPSFLPGYPGDAFFPRAIIIFSIIWIGVILARATLLSQSAEAMGYESTRYSMHWPEFASIVVLVLLYAELLEPIGFEIVTVVLLAVLLIPRMLAAPEVNPIQAVLQALALSIASMLVLYLGLGVFLKISLPLSFLPIFLY
jgi:hypothetical protein